MSTQLDIAALRALRKKATPGEWTDAGSKIGAEGYGIAEVDFDNEHDVPYVVALVNAAPALLDAYDERDRLRADVERLRKALRFMVGILSDLNTPDALSPSNSNRVDNALAGARAALTPPSGGEAQS